MENSTLIREKKIGRLGNTFFKYKVPEEKAMVEADSSGLIAAGFVNFKTLENIVEFISLEIGNGLEVEKEAFFASSGCYYANYLPDEKFREWYDLEMRTEFKEGEKCEFCEKVIKNPKELSVWGGGAYHRKNCFAREVNEHWDIFHKDKFASYLIKIIENFDKDNPILKQLRTKFNLRDIPERIGSAYENYFVTYIIHEDEHMSKEEANEVMIDEINTAREHFRYIRNSFLEMKHLWNSIGLTEKRAKILFNEGYFVKRINEIFEEGAEFSGINIQEISTYNKIEKWCENLFDLYLKLKGKE